MRSDDATLDHETAQAVHRFVRLLEGRHPVSESIVFGSRARGTHRPDSDADLAVVLHAPRRTRIDVALELAGLAFDVFLETGVLIEALPLWADELAHPDRFSNPALLRTIQREGVRLRG